MGEKYRMTSSFLDGFRASFSRKESILAGQNYPLGNFVMEYLEVDRGLFRALDRVVPIFNEELTVFLSARDPSSAATAQQALNAIWDVLVQLPVYRHLGRHGGSVRGLFHDMKESPELVDEMLTPGTGRSAMLHEWLDRLENISPSVEEFIRNTDWMLENYFKDLPSRKPEDYALAFGKYRRDVEGEHQMLLDEREEDDSIPEPDLPQVSFPIQVSFSPVPAPDGSSKCILAEQAEFEELTSFLYYDLCRGMAAGNIPRRCECCGHYFLAMGAYDTRYCMRIAPGETVKTCRQVGAHRKEKQRNGTEFVRKEYQKVYNRLRGRKNRGVISVDEWNRQVAAAQDLKAEAIGGKFSDAELKQRFDEM